MDKYDLNLMEYTQNKFLFENLNMSDRLSIIEKIGCGLEYIHNTIQATHFDLKPSNIMINFEKRPGQKYYNDWNRQTLKIIDFGYACSEGAIQTRAGTPGWASPEQIVHKAEKR